MTVVNQLNANIRLEPIMLSLTEDNYEGLISQIISGLTIDTRTFYDKSVVDKLTKYLWIVNNQLNGHMPSYQTLQVEFPELIFDNVLVIQDFEQLSDYIKMFISQKKQQYLSNRFMVYADTVRGQGLTEQIVESIYKDIAMSEVETEYSKIQDTYLDEYNRQIEMKGISFQCPDLDELTGGILDGQLCTILGASGSMKTTYTSNIAYGAVKSGKNVLYLTLEESPYQLYTKWLSRASVDVGKPLEVQNIAQHKLDPKDVKVLEEEVKPYLDGQPGKVYFVGEQDLTSYSLNSLEAVFKDIDKKAQQETGKGIDLLVVDHIQLIKFAVTNMDPTTVINMYVSFFRQQSLSWLHTKRQVAVILLSQANRDGHTYAMKHDGAYLPQHVAEASEIVRAAAYIISVYTDAMVQVTKQLKVGAVKLRGSQLPTTTINVFADGAFYQVGDDVIPEQMDYSKMSSSGNSDYELDDMFDTSLIDNLNL